MISLLALVALWLRRLWPYAALVTLCAVAVWLLRSCGDLSPQVEVARERTRLATVAVQQAEAVVRVDTVERRVVVVRYQTVRDSARSHLTDTVLVARALDAADSAIARSDTTLDRLRHASEAKDRLIGALRTELHLSNKLRAPRYRVSSYAGLDADGVAPVTGAEFEVRVTGHWSAVGRVEQRWAADRSTRRLLLVRYTL